MAEDTPKVRAKKRQILEAASRVFRRRGFHDAGMREIAAELGMHAGNLYYYFAGKEDLLAFCQQDTLDSLLELAGRVRELPLPPEGKLYLLAAGHVILLNEGTPGSLAHLEVEALEGSARRSVMAKRRRYEHALRELVEEGTASGALRPVDPKVAALAILGALNWTVKWFRPDGGKSARQIAREFAELQVRGLLPPGTDLAPPGLDLLGDALPEPEPPPRPGKGAGRATAAQQ